MQLSSYLSYYLVRSYFWYYHDALILTAISLSQLCMVESFTRKWTIFAFPGLVLKLNKNLCGRIIRNHARGELAWASHCFVFAYQLDYRCLSTIIVLCVCLHVIRHLNSTLGARAVAGSQFGRGVGNILLDNVKCQGSENSLLQCSKNSLHKGHDCDHSEDAGVFCNQGTGVFHWTCSLTVFVGSTLSVSDELLHFQLL